MTMLATSQRQNARPSRWFQTSHGSARPNSQHGAQLMHRSSLFDAAEYHPSKPLMRRNAADQRARSRRLYSDATSAAIKSP